MNMNTMNKRGKNPRNARFKNRPNRGNNNGNSARTRDQAVKKIDHFNSLARDARQNQDIVQYEYYMQHIDHFTRIVDAFAPPAESVTDSGEDVSSNNTSRPSDSRQHSKPQENASVSAHVIEIETTASDFEVDLSETDVADVQKEPAKKPPAKPKAVQKVAPTEEETSPKPEPRRRPRKKPEASAEKSDSPAKENPSPVKKPRTQKETEKET